MIGRLRERAPQALIDVFVRGSTEVAVVEFTVASSTLTIDDFEQAELLISANRGRLEVGPHAGHVGMRVNLFLRRVGQPVGTDQSAVALGNASR